MSSSTVNLYLSRRNLQTLLNKLNRNRVSPNSSACTIVKMDTEHKDYPMVGADTVTVTAVEDALYYKDRPPGQILREDVPDEEYFAGCVDRIVQVLRESSYSDKDKLNLIANVVGV